MVLQSFFPAKCCILEKYFLFLYTILTVPDPYQIYFLDVKSTFSVQFFCSLTKFLNFVVLAVRKIQVYKSLGLFAWCNWKINTYFFLKMYRTQIALLVFCILELMYDLVQNSLRLNANLYIDQCCGSGSGRSRPILSDPPSLSDRIRIRFCINRLE